MAIIDLELRRLIRGREDPILAITSVDAANEGFRHVHKDPVLPQLPSMSDKWYFAGLNANRVLPNVDEDDTPEDVRRFTAFDDVPCEAGDGTSAIFACATQVVFKTNSHLLIRGAMYGNVASVDAADITSIIGVHTGVQGALDKDGNMYEFEPGVDDMTPPVLNLVTQEGDPHLAKVSMTSGERVAVTFTQAPASNTIHIVEFRGPSHFRSWYHHPTSQTYAPLHHHMLPGRIKQIVSNRFLWILLTDGGQMYTWGNAMAGSFGRSINQPGDAPGDKPGLVDGMADEDVIKIAAGGSMFAALTAEGRVYIWTGTVSGGTGLLDMHAGLAPGTLVGVCILDENDNERTFDDFSIGVGHVLLKTPGGKVFAAGDNTNGQLALDSDQDFYGHFVEIVSGGCSFIRAGYRNSVVRASEPYLRA